MGGGIDIEYELNGSWKLEGTTSKSKQAVSLQKDLAGDD